MKRTLTSCVCGLATLALATLTYAQYTSAPRIQLAQDQPAATSNGAAPKASETRTEKPGTVQQDIVTETIVETARENWAIVGPIRLRSADPIETGELQLRAIMNYGTSSDGTDDDVSVGGQVVWGVAPNHELLLGLPLMFGDGTVDGNADLLLGWHWRLWKEDPCGWLPAFALRNILRIPNGVASEGVDWTLKGVLTKSIVPDKFRFHINPFLKVVNSDNVEIEDETAMAFTTAGRQWDRRNQRHFQWGFVTGVDYKLTDCVNLIADYIHESSDQRGGRNQHSFEVGVDWQISKRQTLAFVNRVGLDGDSIGENWGFGVSYILSLDVPACGKSACQ
ncbi:MAG TPA: hypothetical protein PKG54_00820 [Phycisphaerae bacterium]|jgi:hypothetical protein|nr:hypothetical protein [Phycisphaerae bacterium]HOB73041.1 hypothetical protein [Phycisphaerae bacterium]HOJ52910.1 hypothetical protein [Phycisphaerae bacterium]HOL24646.1 hypothetical protein [Phycisphaerae bacterium]HPP19183.1 hypothetical protein [Phycisphaerae bacterium]